MFVCPSVRMLPKILVTNNLAWFSFTLKILTGSGEIYDFSQVSLEASKVVNTKLILIPVTILLFDGFKRISKYFVLVIFLNHRRKITKIM